MRDVAIDMVTPGMTTAQSIQSGDGSGVPLLAAGVVITESIHERLVRSGLTSVLIDDDLSAGIEPTPAITDEVRQSSLAVVRSTLAGLKGPNAIVEREQLDAVEATMNAIVAEISGRRNLLVCLNDLRMFGGDRMEHAVNVCVVGCSVAKRHLEEHGWTDFRGARRQDGVPDRLQKLGIGLLLQDVGSLAIPDEMWAKRGMLSSKERKILQQHPLTGVEMLEGSDLSPLTKITIAQHHERWDGSGYPRGLAREELHDNGQIAAVAEAYVTMCNGGHGGGPTIQPHEAYATIVKAAGRLFQPEIVSAFAKTIAPYGPGTAVELSDGRFGLVVKNHPDDTMHPIVRITHAADRTPVTPPLDLDIAPLQLDIAAAHGGLPGDGPS